MSALQTRTGLGIILAALGGFFISLDIPVIRLSESDPWTFMFFRGLGLAVILGIVIVFFPKLTETPKNPFRDRWFVEVGILFGLSSIFFTLSVFHTSTANLVFILAFNPMLAALFAWWLIGEKPTPITWAAIAATIIGVGIIVNQGLTGGTFWGDVAALIAATGLAFSLVRTRQSGKDLSLSGCLGGMISASFALPIMLLNPVIPGAPAWLIFNVLVLVPLSAFVLQLAPRYLPAPQVAIFFLLETVLAPIWVWLIFADVPSNQTLLGGAIVLSAILIHSVWEIRRAR